MRVVAEFQPFNRTSGFGNGIPFDEPAERKAVLRMYAGQTPRHTNEH
jgi:hypothetical protein